MQISARCLHSLSTFKKWLNYVIVIIMCQLLEQKHDKKTLKAFVALQNHFIVTQSIYRLAPTETLKITLFQPFVIATRIK